MVKNNQVGGDGDFSILEGIVGILGDIFSGLASFLGMVGEVPPVPGLEEVAEQAGGLAQAAGAMAGGYIEYVENAASSAASGVVSAVTEMGEHPPVLGHHGVMSGHVLRLPGTGTDYRRSGNRSGRIQRRGNYDSDSDSDSDSDEDDSTQTPNRPLICEGGWSVRTLPGVHCPDGKVHLPDGKIITEEEYKKNYPMVGGGNLSPELEQKIREAVNKIKATQKKVNELENVIRKFRGTGNVALAAAKFKTGMKRAKAKRAKAEKGKIGGKRRRTRKKRRNKKRKTKKRR